MKALTEKIRFVDLFCGVGGFRLGLQAALPAAECVFSCDVNPDCRVTYNANFGEMPQTDIKQVQEKAVPDHDVLCAGFPCQPFSICGRQKGFADMRGTLFFELCRIIAAKKPRVVLLENVKHLIHHDGGRTFEVIISTLCKLGYCTAWKILNAADFGVPQNRERVFIVATLDKAFDFSKLQTLKRVNIASVLERQGAFEFLKPGDYTLLSNPTRQEKSGLVFAGFRNKKQRIAGVRAGTLHLSRVHKQPNRIYSVLGTHPTLPSQETSGRFYVLLEDGKTVRKLTLNECWRMMGFPENFKRPSIPGAQYRQLGNAVVPAVISAISEQIIYHL